jgi:hypothetical protein
LKAQFITRVAEYIPAPGQYTNAEFIGTPEAANSIIGTTKGLVSLGAFGGSAVFYVESGIKNDPANPYGVDFTVYGNATSTWSEPGIIQVMKDENKNGIPDETWYEIAGSDHFWNSTIKTYEITYFNNGQTQLGNILWTDNQGKNGIVPQNSFHQQPYYPQQNLFPQIPAEKYSLKGTQIAGKIDLSNPGVVNSYRRTFGYADNTPVLSTTEKLPDNPYSTEIEGSGGDAIDIGWAVDQNLKPVILDEIHFIRIYTGMNDIAGWLGEISTEITGIRDIDPATASGVSSIVVIQDLPLKLVVGESVQLAALFFDKGIRSENSIINWSVDQPELAALQNGLLKTTKPGTIRIKATSGQNAAVFAEKIIEIIDQPKSVITVSASAIKVNDKLELSGKFTDQGGNILSGITPLWKSGNESIATISPFDGKYYLKGLQTGKIWLYLEATEMQSKKDSVQIEIFPESSRKKVFISIKTNEKTLLPRQSLWVDLFDFTAKVDRAQKSYGLQQFSFISLAHVVASALKTSAFNGEWAFRDDAEGGSALYLWKVPETDEGSTIYHFGYGGSRSSGSYRKTWIVLHNQQQLANGFEQVKIENGDEIMVYFISDNGLPWQVDQLTLADDSIKTGQKNEVLCKQYSCSMDAAKKITISSSGPIANQKVAVLQNNQSIASLMTDEFGKTSFTPTESGNYIISGGINLSLMNVESTTGIDRRENNLQCRVFPNPFSGEIRIDSPKPITGLEISDVSGRLIMKQSGNESILNLPFLDPGVYLIRINADNGFYQQKIIKR